MQSIDTLLFDLDDTLIVEWGSAENSFVETIRKAGLPFERELFIKTIREVARTHWYRLPTIGFCRRIGISSWEALWADFSGDDVHFRTLRSLSGKYRFDTWNETLIRYDIQDAGLAKQLSDDFKDIRSNKHVLYPETAEVLSGLKGKYKLGLITNGAPDLQWKKINGGGLGHYFDIIAISGEHGFAKPDTRLFDVALAGLGASKEGTIMVGDSLNTDIKGGLDCGIRTVWINRDGKTAKDIQPDDEVNSLLEMVEWMS